MQSPSLVGVGRAERPLAGPGHEALGLVEGGVGVTHGTVVEELEVVRVVRVHRVRPHHLLLVEVQRRHGSHGLRPQSPARNGTVMRYKEKARLRESRLLAPSGPWEPGHAI